MKLNKIYLQSDFNEITDFCLSNDIEILPISFEHVQVLNGLELHHNDPFDRLLIAQGIAEKITFLTKDQHFKSYGVKCFW